MKRFVGLAAISLALSVAAVSHAATFPPDPAWIPLTQNGMGLGDPSTDGQGNAREIIGSATDPAVYIYSDGTDFFVRLRLDVDPEQSPGNLRPYGWGLLIDTDNNFNDYEYSLMVNGIGDVIEFAENTTKTGVGDPSDIAETLLNNPADPWNPAQGGNGRVLVAPTTFNSDPDYFLDFAIPVAYLTAAGIGMNDPLVFWAGTSSNARSISVDLVNSPNTPGPGELAGAASDPVTLGGLSTDTDGDGVPNGQDSDPNNPNVCMDSDGDGCDDCSSGTFAPGNDGPDFDSDGICDQGDDSDGDGLSDAQELANGTDPNDADSDDDGVLDGAEIDWNTDTDGDGLINALDPDSDNDGLFDGTELGLDCNDAATDTQAGHCVPDGDAGQTTTDPLNPDTDGGGVSDGSEDANLNGVIDSGEGDPNVPSDDTGITDTDGDGLSDALEAHLGTDPNDGDTDDDGVLDGDEANPSDDTDGDGLINVLDVDSDNDGLYDGTEMGLGCSDPDTDPGPPVHCIPDGDNGTTTTSPLKKDTDDGGVSDGSEDPDLDGVIDSGELDPNNPADDGTVTDSDGDGLSDALEATLGTDPNNADSDNDGVLDGDEPNPADDVDGDGLPNALDPDSDGDGLFDGTEMGKDCSHADTDEQAGNCVPDGDAGATTTNPLLADTDGGGVPDGGEDLNGNGVIDGTETDPNNPADDVVPPECDEDADCGGLTSGQVCHDTNLVCIDGCRGEGGNGCPVELVCTSTDTTIGECVDPGTGGGGTGGVGGSGGAGGSTSSSGTGGSTSSSSGTGGAAEDEGLAFSGGACACATVARGPDGAQFWALAGLGLALAWRRRRSRGQAGGRR